MIRKKQLKPIDLLKLSIMSGLSGLDLKGAAVASSSFSQSGIDMRPYLDLTKEEAAKAYFKELFNRINCSAPVFQWDRFLEDISKEKIIRIAWFTDDYIETFFDLLFIDNMLSIHNNTTVTVIPKNGSFGNDASWSDIVDMINLGIFSENLNEDNMRFRICKNGPRVGTLNLKKLPSQSVDEVYRSDFVIIKGCRSHEMVQGGLNKPSYTMYVVSREFSESVTGYDARKSPILFFYLGPNEYAFKGFKDRHLRRKIFNDGRIIYLSKLTLADKIGDSHE